MKIAYNSTKKKLIKVQENCDRNTEGGELCFPWELESFTDSVALEKDLKNEYGWRSRTILSFTSQISAFFYCISLIQPKKILF